LTAEVIQGSQVSNEPSFSLAADSQSLTVPVRFGTDYQKMMLAVDTTADVTSVMGHKCYSCKGDVYD